MISQVQRSSVFVGKLYLLERTMQHFVAVYRLLGDGDRNPADNDLYIILEVLLT